MKRQPRDKYHGTSLCAVFLSMCFSLAMTSAEKTYSPKSADEIEILALVLHSEVQANNLTKRDLICITVDQKDPSRKMVKALRQQDLNVCSEAEWRKHLSCAFDADLRFVNLDPSENARVRADVSDLRDIIAGNAHVAIWLRRGEYLAKKVDGKWAITEYVPWKPEKTTK